MKHWNFGCKTLQFPMLCKILKFWVLCKTLKFPMLCKTLKFWMLCKTLKFWVLCKTMKFWISCIFLAFLNYLLVYFKFLKFSLKNRSENEQILKLVERSRGDKMENVHANIRCSSSVRQGVSLSPRLLLVFVMLIPGTYSQQCKKGSSRAQK